MIIYLLKTIACSAILYAFYFFFLSKEKMLVFNRFYLLGIILIAFLGPILPISFSLPNLGQRIQQFEIANTRTEPLIVPPAEASKLINSTMAEHSSYNIGLTEWLFISYVIVTVLLLIRFGMNLRRLYYLIRGNAFTKVAGARLILVHDRILPFTFLSYIFFNAADYQNPVFRNTILSHERAHVRQRHSVDVLVVELLNCFLWYNPFFFLIKKSIKINHEFLADAYALEQERNGKDYCTMLISLMQGSIPATPLVSNFDFLTAKKRLTMMTKTTSFTKAVTLHLAAICLVTTVALLLSAPGMSQNTPARSGSRAIAQNKGVPQSLIDEYNATLKNAVTESTGKDGKKRMGVDMRKINTIRMDSIYYAMSKEQRTAARTIYMIVPSMPLVKPKKKMPSSSQFELWKRPDLYGVWIDDKKVANTALNKYAASDFVYYDASKLYGAAKKNKPYSVQLNLYTEKGYESVYRDWANTREEYYRNHYYREAD